MGEKSYLRQVSAAESILVGVRPPLAAACDGGNVIQHITQRRGQDIIAHIASSRCYELSVWGLLVCNTQQFNSVFGPDYYDL